MNPRKSTQVPLKGLLLTLTTTLPQTTIDCSRAVYDFQRGLFYGAGTATGGEIVDEIDDDDDDDDDFEDVFD